MHTTHSNARSIYDDTSASYYARAKRDYILIKNNLTGGSLELYTSRYIQTESDKDKTKLTPLEKSVYNAFDKKTITNENIKVCNNKKLITKERNSRFPDIETHIKSMYSNFTEIVPDNMLDLYYSIPMRMFTISYIAHILDGDDVNFLRSKKFVSPFTDASDLLDKMKRIIFSNKPLKADQYQIDKNPLYRPFLISTNLSLFGNEYGGNEGESSFDYYIKGGTQLRYNLNDILRYIFFKQYPILKYKWFNIIISVFNEMNIVRGPMIPSYNNNFPGEPADTGVMMQVLIPKKHINDFTYISYEYGIPVFPDGDVKVSDYISKTVDEKISCIMSARDKFKELVPYKSQLNRDECLKINSIQARIVVTANLLKNKEVKVNYRYSNESIMDQCIEKLKRIADIMKDDLMKGDLSLSERILTIYGKFGISGKLDPLMANFKQYYNIDANKQTDNTETLLYDDMLEELYNDIYEHLKEGDGKNNAGEMFENIYKISENEEYNIYSNNIDKYYKIAKAVNDQDKNPIRDFLDKMQAPQFNLSQFAIYLYKAINLKDNSNGEVPFLKQLATDFITVYDMDNKN